MASTLALLTLAVIITAGRHYNEQSPGTNGRSTGPSDAAAESADLQNLAGELKPEHLTFTLAEVLDDARQQDAAKNPVWRDYSLPGQPVSILMPGNPRPLIRQHGGLTVRGAEVDLESEPSGEFSILFIDHKVAPRDIGRHFEGTKQGMLNSIPFGQLVGERTICVTDEGGNEHPGREFRIDSDVFGKETRYLYRIYMVGTKMIILFTGLEQPATKELQANSTKFLDSLRITASVPPVE